MTTTRTIRAGSLRARFSAHRRKRIQGDSLPLANYRQQDAHSCGFLAALTVIQHLLPETVPMSEVLDAVRPDFDRGTSRRQVVRGLAQFGISAPYRDDLTVWHLHSFVQVGVPVIISVFPQGWEGDHWTVVQGFSAKRVYLTNHYSLSLGLFVEQWIENWGDGSETGAGLVCERS